MKRVMIVGQPGGGKSYLARELGRLTGLPVIHVDLLHWCPGWVERPRGKKIAMALEIERSPQWIFEGSLSATFDHRLSRADTLVILDMPLGLRLWRVFWRTLKQHGKTREDLPRECPERFDLEFWTFIWRTRNTARRRNRALVQQAGPDVAVHHLKSRRDVTRFLQGLDSAGATGQEAGHGSNFDRTAGSSR